MHRCRPTFLGIGSLRCGSTWLYRALKCHPDIRLSDRNALSSDYCRTIQIWSKAFGRDALHIDFFDRLRDDPQAFINGVLRHIGATTPWTLPAQFIKNKVHATSTIVPHQRDIPEVVQ